MGFFLGTKQPEAVKLVDLNSAVSRFNHAIATGDCTPMFKMLDMVSVYSFNLFGEPGIAYGEGAPELARTDFQRLHQLGIPFELSYEDGAVLDNRGFWLLELSDKRSGEKYLASLTMSLSEKMELDRFVLLADRPLLV